MNTFDFLFVCLFPNFFYHFFVYIFFHLFIKSSINFNLPLLIFLHTFYPSFTRISPIMLCLGLSQSFFEGAVYTFGESLDLFCILRPWRLLPTATAAVLRCSVIGLDLKWCDLICWSKDWGSLTSFLCYINLFQSCFFCSSSPTSFSTFSYPFSRLLFPFNIPHSSLSVFMWVPSTHYHPLVPPFSHLLLPLSPSLPYLSVFMWVPSLIKVNGTQSLPTGLVFSSFMLAMTFGGMLFGLLLPVFPGGAEGDYYCLTFSSVICFLSVVVWYGVVSCRVVWYVISRCVL